MLLNAWDAPVTKENVTKILSSFGAAFNEDRIDNLVSSLKDIDSKAAIKESQVPIAVEQQTKTQVNVEEIEDRKKKQDDALDGLSKLFGD